MAFRSSKGPTPAPRRRRSINLAAAITEAAAPVLRDARTAGHHDVEVATWSDDSDAAWVEAASDGEARALVTVTEEGGATGVTIWLQDELAAQVAAIAEVVQDAIVEAHGSAFPACPAHPNHPMWVRFEEGMAWPEWRCPRGAAAFRVGKLSSTLP